ncbi:hypothetical protein JG687_00001389 [Phytophthora cactorum]|uniref:Uncharacterized protein n=1 Tax=Phytophthora cactorum TaxID=29920 RepID=A0A329SQ67_9STRA|nr:hypothetical protein Pcac1_g551 [Phytophthora cactorum]KAG2830592.1 hypothetical protein PC111_g7326 [Phytophthora cactorum]KAG2841779.1 hypothetical protein PC112_g3256 [Phytophthora cactorum]KAG2859415.1 hypothetical protein PC113_g8957 [Phytophthora cactorum]KAG2925865.1 hypothetical protein PC114_g3999 [Phytophthora cactorum]
MEGYLIRVPVEACFPDSRPAWRQISEARGSVNSRILYYIVEEGYLRGYHSPCDRDEAVESFQLTSHRIEVNAMYSLNIFEIKARAVKLPPTQQFVEDTSSSSSDSSDDDDNSTAKRVEPAKLYRPQVALSSSPQPLSGSYHVVFFAPNKELVKKWSVKLLNWNRYVFSSSDGPDEEELNLAKDEIIEALRVVNAADRFLRPVQLRTREIASDNAVNSPPSVGIIPAPVDTLNVPSCVTTTSTLTPTESTKPAVEVVKPSDVPSQPSNPWWVVPLGRSKRISAYSLRR